MTKPRRLFAGAQLRRIRSRNRLLQSHMAERLGISASYLSQLENDDRPLTPMLAERVARSFPLDWEDLDTSDTEILAVALREAASDPLFESSPEPELLARLVDQQPDFARRFVALHEAYRRTSQRLEMVDETTSVDGNASQRLPWEEIRDWFHLSNNYVDPLDRAAEELAATMCGTASSPSRSVLEECLREHHKVTVKEATATSLRQFDEQARQLLIERGQAPASAKFQIAYQLAALSLEPIITHIAQTAELRSPAARQLLKIGLTNYAAGAMLMPYEVFRRSARECRHDIDRLCIAFGTSFEQVCHRLSNLQREGARGLPVFFCRVDLAGNITKRHSATRLQFARFGGACPLWIVHEAVAIPDRVLVQLAETPDGARYVSMAKGLVKPSGSFDRQPRRYAVALGCEARHASEFIYADGIDLQSERSVTKIGISCRICSRVNCDQRAYPPSDQAFKVDLTRRGVVPYELGDGSHPTN